METLSLLGVALGFATLSGINLYLTTFLAGLAVRFNWINLAEKYESLDVLANPWIIGIAGVLFLLEFFADKIPWIDSSWDAIHTLIRPVGGTLLALAALGEMDPVVSVIAALLSGSTTLVTHATKAGGRLLINMSPEPVSNAVASLGEDGLVLGGLGLMAVAPVVSFFVFLAIVLLAVWLSRRTWGIIRKGLTALKRRLQGGTMEDAAN
ncbi:MAG: DUF4126 domain-containing protein [Akkermansiaceae bacterium]|nr:DUF4126 domain-containing protein [Akkermansiaceae bacterium]